MDTFSLFSGLVAGGIFSPLLIKLISIWFSTRLKGEIEEKNKKKYFLFKESRIRKARVDAQTEKVIEIILEWVSEPIDRKKLNRLLLEANLWLPSDMIRALGVLIRNERDDNLEEIVYKIRKKLNEYERDAISVSEMLPFKF